MLASIIRAGGSWDEPDAAGERCPTVAASGPVYDRRMKCVPLIAALDAEQRRTSGRSGPMSYYVDGDGPPLLLLHSINAAASAHEIAPLFKHAVALRRVYAPDLPGFGFSNRSDRRYGIGLYCDAVRDMLGVIEDDCGEQPVDVLALSLSGEFAARVASETPVRIRSLALVTPTGFTRGANLYRAAPGANREIPMLHALLRIPLWRDRFHEVVVSRRSIRYFLQRTFGSKNIPDCLVDAGTGPVQQQTRQPRW